MHHDNLDFLEEKKNKTNEKRRDATYKMGEPTLNDIPNFCLPFIIRYGKIMRSICCQETILSSTPASDEQKARNGQWQLTVTRSPYRAAACVSSRREKSNKTPFFHVGDGGNTQTVIPEAIGAPRLRHFFIFFFFLMYNIGEERIRIRLADAVRKQWHSGVLQFRRNKSFTYKETLHHIECIPMELRYRRRRLPQAKDLFTGFIIDRNIPTEYQTNQYRSNRRLIVCFSRQVMRRPANREMIAIPN